MRELSVWQETVERIRLGSNALPLRVRPLSLEPERPAILAAVGLNMLRLVLSAQGSERVLLADLDEMLRAIADVLDHQTTWLRSTTVRPPSFN